MSNYVVQHIPLSEILCDQDWNSRGPVSGADVLSLAKLIEDQGLLQPITLMPYNDFPGKKYKIVVGHRRFLAFKSLKRETIPAMVNSTLDDNSAKVANLIENLERKNLNILQEAKGIEGFYIAGWTHQEIAKKLGQSTGWVSIRLQLLKLEPEIQQEAAAGLLTQYQIKEIADLPSKGQRFEAVRKIKDAKIKGEKPQISTKKKKVNPLKRKKREAQEIFDMIEHIQEYLEYGIHTRCLAWAAGEISDFDLFRDIKEECETQGKSYRIPKEYEEFRDGIAHSSPGAMQGL